MHPRTLFSWSWVLWFSPLVQQHWLEPYFRLGIYVFCWVCKVEVNNLPMNWRAFLNWLFKVIQDWMVVASLRSFGWFRKLALSFRTNIWRKTKARTCGLSEFSSSSHNLNLSSLGLGGSLWCFLFSVWSLCLHFILSYDTSSTPFYSKMIFAFINAITRILAVQDTCCMKCWPGGSWPQQNQGENS